MFLLHLQVNINIGILVAYALGWPYGQNQAYFLPFFRHEVAWWRVMFVLGIVPALLQVMSLSCTLTVFLCCLKCYVC